MTDLVNDARSTDELFRVALSLEGDAAWDAVAALHWRGTEEVLEKSIILSRSSDAKERARAADILGQLGIPDRTFPDQCFDNLLRLLSDKDVHVTSAAILGLQHLDRDQAAPFVLPYAEHADAKVRYAVAVTLGGVETPPAISALLTLSNDRDDEVRDWATFGLGQLSEEDSNEIRDALANNLADGDADVRYEAAIGLGRRQDSRAAKFIIDRLRADPEDLFAREAAAVLLNTNDGEKTPSSDLIHALKALQS